MHTLVVYDLHNYELMTFQKMLKVFYAAKWQNGKNSVLLSFLEKNPIGYHVLFSNCSIDTPMAVVGASVVSATGAFDEGNSVLVVEGRLLL